jgi:DNA-binding PadR family transcriptional regulator
MAKDTLGEFEHHVLLVAHRLGEQAYSAAIVMELERLTGREVAPAAVYIALRRLEKVGFARSELRVPEDGSRRRRYFAPTPGGVRQMQESRRRFEALWHGVRLGDV